MSVCKGLPEDVNRVEKFYADLLDMMRDDPYRPRWQKGLYPSRQYILDSLQKGELYYWEVGGQIASAMILNHACNSGYAKVNWSVAASGKEIFVIHILAVLPTFSRRGIAGKMIAYALHTASRYGGRTVRLDVRKGTLPAQKLYESMGFKKIAEIGLYYESTDWTDFVLYEHAV